jgi:hypothetical protein
MKSPSLTSPEIGEPAAQLATSSPVEATTGIRLHRRPQLTDAILLTYGGVSHGLPHIERVIVSMLLGAEDVAPVCILLPSTEGIAQLTAILSALECLAADFPAARAEFVESLVPGTRVRALPDGYVFIVGRRSVEYGMDGVFLRYTEKKTLETNGSCFVPVEQLLRYEATTRKLPISRGASQLSKPRPSVVDELAMTTAYGNSTLYRTRVILVGSRTVFENTMESASIVPRSAPENWWGTGRLADSFAWGTFDSSGKAVVLNPSGSAGSPLVAITRDFLDLERPCLGPTSSPRSQLVVTDRFDLMMRSLDLANRIGERQRLIVLADARRRSEIEPLRDHGWRVWEPSPTELLGSASRETGPLNVGVPGIDCIQRSAQAERNPSVDFVEKESGALSIAHGGLTELGALLTSEAAEFDERMQDTLENVRSIFFQAANWLSLPTRDRLGVFTTSLERIKAARTYIERYLGPQAGAALNQFVAGIEAFLNVCADGGRTAKGKAILDLAKGLPPDPVYPQALVTGSRQSREEANSFLRTNGLAIHCRLASDLIDSDESERVIGFSILRRDMFARFIDPWPAKSLIFAGYDFEIGIYKQRLHRRDIARQRLKIDEPARTALTGFPPADFGVEVDAPISASPTLSSPDRDLESFDAVTGNSGWNWQRRISIPRIASEEGSQEAWIVRFVGRSWMPVTEDHGLVRLVRSGSDRTKSAVEHVETSDLHPGNRIILREGTERDVIRAIAQQIRGKDKYDQLREKASLWRDALKSSPDDPWQIAKRLEDAGVSRHIVTIRSWLANSSLIGPRSDNDVMAIAEAFPLPGMTEADWKTCCDAISELRGLHLSAGMRLTDLLVTRCGSMLFEPAETELAIDLDLGIVWILEVAAIEASPRECPNSIVNRLQWLDPLWHDRLLRERIKAGVS